MATQTSNRVCDNSTLANFKSWAQAISTAFSTFGWAQSADTGQVNWGTIISAPGSGAYVYEIWTPNDIAGGISNNFYVKVEYGNFSGTNSPTIRVTIGASTNGSGTITGTYIIGPLYTAPVSITAPSAVTTYACYFSGAAGRFSCLMWPSGPNNSPQTFSIERSLDSSGAKTNSYVTLIIGGAANSFNDWPMHQQQSLVFGTGVTPLMSRSQGSNVGLPSLGVRTVNNATTSAFNSNIPFDTVAPCVGYFDYPTTVVGIAYGADITEQIAFSVTLYGGSKTYMPTKASNLKIIFNNGGAAFAYAIRYD